MFNTRHTFSLTETIMKWVPENLKSYAKMIESMMTTSTISYLLPEIVEEFQPSKRVDVRCGFSKEFLDGHLNEMYVS